MDKLKPSNNQKEGKKGKTGEQKTGETGINGDLGQSYRMLVG